MGWGCRPQPYSHKSYSLSMPREPFQSCLHYLKQNTSWSQGQEGTKSALFKNISPRIKWYVIFGLIHAFSESIYWNNMWWKWERGSTQQPSSSPFKPTLQRWGLVPLQFMLADFLYQHSQMSPGNTYILLSLMNALFTFHSDTTHLHNHSDMHEKIVAMTVGKAPWEHFLWKTIALTLWSL